MSGRGFVVVRLGGFGEQVAEVLGLGAPGILYVRKWREKSGRWTGRVRVAGRDVLRTATERDLEARGVRKVQE